MVQGVAFRLDPRHKSNQTRSAVFRHEGVRTLKTDRLASRDSHWKAEKNARGATFAEYAGNGRA